MKEEIIKAPFECKVCDAVFEVISEQDDVVFYCPFCGIDLGDLTEDEYPEEDDFLEEEFEVDDL